MVSSVLEDWWDMTPRPNQRVNSILDHLQHIPDEYTQEFIVQLGWNKHIHLSLRHNWSGIGSVKENTVILKLCLLDEDDKPRHIKAIDSDQLQILIFFKNWWSDPWTGARLNWLHAVLSIGSLPVKYLGTQCYTKYWTADDSHHW